MSDYNNYTREQLIEEIQKLEDLNQAIVEEKEKEELLDFSWTGNLGHWYWHFPTNTVTHNPLKVKTLGYSTEELPDKLTYQFFTDKLHPDDYEGVMQVMREHLKGQREVYEVEYRIQTKEGNWKYFYDRGKVTKRDEQGNPVILAGIVFDVTEKKEAEKALADTNRQLQEAIQTRDKFFSIISHDLKKGFQHLLGIPDLILRNFGHYSDEKIRHMVGIVKKEAETTHALLENLFEWSKAQRGAIEFRPEKINIANLGEECIRYIKPKADSKDFILVNQLEDKEITADRNMLQAILRNLLDNGVKFSPSGGRIQLKGRVEGHSYHFEISDEGQGMPRSIRDNLFKIDQDVSRPGTQKEKGSGLGLILCKEFVENHGGSIWADSYENQGSVFHFTLPLDQAH